MKILAIDPGTEKSGVVICTKDEIDFAEELANDDVINEMSTYPVDEVVIENIESFGLAVGKTTFETCIWIGRFWQHWKIHAGKDPHLIFRGDEKIVLCGCKTFIDPITKKRKGVTDTQIRKAIIERYPPTGGGKIPQIGIKKQPGPLYGFSKHLWSALAVAITWFETYGK